MEYRPRLLDDYLSDLVKALPAVVIEGAKGVGKTALASRLAAAQIRLDDPLEIEALKEDPRRLTRLPRPLLIDEWQYYPPIWDQVRRAVDADWQPGSFILTGSAVPGKQPKHSGAARIVHQRMRPFALTERGLGQPTVSVNALLTGQRPDIDATGTLTIEDYADEIVRGGFPTLREVPDRFRRAAWNSYLAELFERDLPELGRPVRRGQMLQAWLRAYASATSTTASYTTILDAAMPADTDKPSQSTTIAWRETLARLWLVEPLPAWDDPLHRLPTLAKSPKHHLVDPALAAHLLGITAATLLEQPHPDQRPVPRRATLFGALFESLVAQSVRVIAEIADATVSHLRTKNGDHEVDLIVTRPDGKAVAIEVKAAPGVETGDLKHLHWLQDKLGTDLLDSVVITSGTTAYRRTSDGIVVVPAALIGL